MDGGVENANPTILSHAELPTRQNKKRSTGKTGIEHQYDHIILARPDYLSPLYGTDDVAWFDGPLDDTDGLTQEPIDEQEIYDLISTISDPEHPLSLGQLAVVNLPDIYITRPPSTPLEPNTLVTVRVEVTPTITHCSLATVIGLGIRVRLEQALPPNYRVDVRIKEKTHSQDDQVNKQLADKERVAAAMENETLRGVLDKMLETCV
ncbi:hypothetical protein SODALDRAFT_12903 [Sodiomyces alkalinus F11]|uniref:Uncharacterized protein n=1 Tax=Sodiomyces alkalinus (strain CBS 110278 / VKM F-3762 / F11) TaxID=1314773 RepID=A0A3N2Q6E2_SODAK|nr:hypothetical protein SODALDRAFT_12903 [Sodiomyces alkalinus F11]ROT42334.1 hypothetical protein SODALDRAFT_12903 [Sodiomyces alkalinus F11]